MSLRLEDDWADITVNSIIDDLNDRSGLGIDSLEEDIQEEIKQTWAGIIRESAGKWILNNISKKQI